ncbi:DUF6786 family protein [Lunatimonas lonarensis]|nr:DUF6786 family protein [Lunatimonas lonarensis]
MNKARTFLFFIAIQCIISCQTRETQEVEIQIYPKGSFGYDVDFLAGVDDSFLVLSRGMSSVLVSPRFQGKVFTSTAAGMEGNSYGWMNYDAIGSGQHSPHINAYGGEDRLWLGPEGGPFSIFFPPGSDMVFDNWQTPAGIDSESWDLAMSSDDRVSMTKSIILTNYAGTAFHVKLDRAIRIIGSDLLEEEFGFRIPTDLEMVAFESVNGITNEGESPWGRDEGTVCLWVLGMFNPSDKLTIIIPYQEGPEADLGPIATTDYFGEIPGDRIKMDNGLLFFKGDGGYRSKLGLSPDRAKSLMGSFDSERKVLTLVTYNKPSDPLPYLNQVWGLQDFPFQGDAVNSYNDGPLEDGTQMGPFYELETVSPAAFLAPGERLEHVHRTYHFEGSEAQMSALLAEIFGISLETLNDIF